jgi:hypothetical protein
VPIDKLLYNLFLFAQLNHNGDLDQKAVFDQNIAELSKELVKTGYQLDISREDDAIFFRRIINIITSNNLDESIEYSALAPTKKVEASYNPFQINGDNFVPAEVFHFIQKVKTLKQKTPVIKIDGQIMEASYA